MSRAVYKLLLNRTAKMASETLKRIIELDAISPTYLSSAYVPVTSYLSSDSSSSRHTYALPIGIASQDMYGLLRLIDGPTGNATDGTMTQRAIMSAIAAGELAGPTGATGASGVSVTGPTGSSGKDGTDGEQGPTGPRGQSSDSVIEHLVVNGTEVPVKDKTASIALPTLVSELANDSGFINSSVADLVNYYTKAQTYTQQEIMGLIAQITSVHIEIVDALPAEGESNIIYCVPKTAGSAADGYAEWYWLSSQSRFEYFGTTDVDLSQYYNKTESDLRFVRSAYVDTSVPESPDDSHVPSTLLATKIALASGIGEYSRDTDGNIITADIFRKAEKNTGYNVDFGDGTSDMSGSAYSLCVGNGNTVKGDHNFVLGNVPAYTDGSTITGNHNIFVGESTYAFYNGNMGSVASVILNCGMGPVSCTSSVARSLITCNGYLNNTFDSVIGGNGITCHRAYSGILHGDGNEYNLIYGFVAGSSNYIGKYTTETASDGTVTTTDTLVSCATCVGNGNYIYGNYGTVFGNGNTSYADNTLIVGNHLIGRTQYAVAFGQYNVDDTEGRYALSVGNGNETARTNIFNLWKQGIIELNVSGANSIMQVVNNSFILGGSANISMSTTCSIISGYGNTVSNEKSSGSQTYFSEIFGTSNTVLGAFGYSTLHSSGDFIIGAGANYSNIFGVGSYIASDLSVIGSYSGKVSADMSLVIGFAQYVGYLYTDASGNIESVRNVRNMLAMGNGNYINEPTSSPGKYTLQNAALIGSANHITCLSESSCVFAFGNGNTVIKSNAFVAGSGNYALDPNVSLIGQGLVSSGDGSNSIVLGKYNNSIADMLLVLGNGSETSRSNALTVSPRGDTTAHTFIGGTYKSAASNFVVSGTGATATVAPNKHAIIGTAGVLPTEVTGQLYVVLSGTAPVSSIDCADAYEFEFTTSSSALSEVKVEYADGAPVTWSQLPPAYAASRRYVFRVYDGMLSYECYSVADEMWCHIQNNGTWVEVSHTVGSVVYGEMEGIAEPSNPNPGIIMNGASGVYLPNGIYDFSNEYTVMVNEAYPYFIKLNIAVIAGSITLREQSFYFHGDYPGVYQCERAGGVFKINGATAANRLVRIKVSTNDVGGGSALSSGDTICLFKPSHIFLHMVR